MEPAAILEVQGFGATREYLLSGCPVLLGRAEDNTIVLDDASVSRHHVRIEWLEGHPHLTDLGSANGTLINGAAVAANAPKRLVFGDGIQIVDFELTLREPAARQVERRDLSGQSLPGDEAALLTRAEPGSVTVAVSAKPSPSWSVYARLPAATVAAPTRLTARLPPATTLP